MPNTMHMTPKIKKDKEITLTKTAAQQILSLINQNPQNKGVRLSIKKSGCAGFRYVMKLVKNKKKEDIESIQYGITIFISIKLLNFLEGITIDFTSNGLNKVFSFNHPNTKNYCGCGESFEITDKKISLGT